METKKGYIKKVLFIVILALLMLGIGVFGTITYFKKFPNSVEQITNITKTEKEVTVTDSGIADAVEKIYDAVVTVVTYKNSSPYSSGTGFVYKIDGDIAYILTNYHVINGSKNITVSFTNKTIVDAKIVGGDLYADVAVLSVEADKVINVAELGSSENMRLGDTAFAVGSPVSDAYGWTVTRGILSGKDRMVSVSLSNSLNNSETAIMNVLQTDVAINSGNSGGPLCNSNGQVIGITSSKVSSTGVEGIGFAIPIEDALNIADILEKGETVKRPYVGVSILELAVAQYFGYTKSELEAGVYVSEVVAKSPSDKAGIKAGDIIVDINGEKITSLAEFRYELYKHKVGDTVKIKVNRDGNEKLFDVKLGTNS